MQPSTSPGDAAAPHQRVAGIDFGKMRVGVAVSDELGLFAHPRPTLDGRNRRALLRDLGRLAEADGVELFVVGWPLDQHGQPGIAADRAQRFAQQLSDATGRPVELLDERWTSVQAERRLREGGHSRRASRKHVDAVAATLILQAWLDRRAATDRRTTLAAEGPEGSDGSGEPEAED